MKLAVPGDPGVAREARVLEALAVAGAADVPRVEVARDELLAVRWVAGPTLHAVRRSRTKGGALDGVIGTSLARLQAVGARWAAPFEAAPSFARSLLWVSPEQFALLGPAGRALTATVQASERAVQTLSWLTQTEATVAGAPTLVHADLRQANLLVRGRRVTFIDWEGAGLGDPARDVGSLLADDFRAWVEPATQAEVQSKRDRDAHARAVVRAWEAERRRLGARSLEHQRARIVGWLAEGLLRQASSAAHHHHHFAQHVVAAAVTLLEDPIGAARDLFGGQR
ncbi:MAG: aminoglycoside phosphotransferase family protein [Myxococcaceae bacterium]